MRTRKMRAHFLCHMRPEILAPAGTPAALLAAVRAGADAIYLGGSLFSARAFAGNFNQEELLKAIEDCHLFNVKLYMTVNTLMKEKEMSGLVSYMKPFYRAGLDGVIVQDVGCAKVLQEAFPDLALHASTQMSISSAYGAALLKTQGFKRVVPARELSLAEIKEIKKESGIEIETFVHGAMCFSYSGKCLLSSFAGGRSGNRGRCAQPCRKCYELLNAGTQEYAMSMKDMCTLRILPDLIDAGIDSFKIEGRMKNPVYVASTVNAYRKARDYYLDAVASGTFDRTEYEDFIYPLEKELADIYNRGGFSEGYYFMEKGPEMMANERPNHTGVLIGKVERIAPPELFIRLTEDVFAQDVLEIRPAGVELTSAGSGKKGALLSIKGKEFRLIQKGQEVFRTRNNQLISRIQKEIIDPEKQVPVQGKIIAKAGEPLTITLQGEVCVTAKSAVVEKAKKQPTGKEDLLEKLQKTGGSEISIEAISIEMDQDIFIPMSAFNQLRREAMEQYRSALVKRFERDI